MPPAVVVTVTSTTPAARAGEVAEIDVSLLKVTPVAGVPPKATVAPLVKLVPVIVTSVPPPMGPMLGLMLETVGATTSSLVIVPVALAVPRVAPVGVGLERVTVKVSSDSNWVSPTMLTLMVLLSSPVANVSVPLVAV